MKEDANGLLNSCCLCTEIILKGTKQLLGLFVDIVDVTLSAGDSTCMHMITS